MSHIFPVTQSLNPFEKFCLWALMIAIFLLQSANWQFVNFVHLEKGLIVVTFNILYIALTFQGLIFSAQVKSTASID